MYIPVTGLAALFCLLGFFLCACGIGKGHGAYDFATPLEHMINVLLWTAIFFIIWVVILKIRG